MIFTRQNTFDISNILFKPVTLKYEKSFYHNKNIYYMSIIDNYIYCKQCISEKPYDEFTIRINIENPLLPIFDKNFYKDFYVASHNMYCFKDNSDNIKAIGGQALGINSKEYFNDIGFKSYFDLNPFINSHPYGITMNGCDKIHDPNIICPYYGNGLHLFELKDDNFICVNKNLPIISGIHLGRNDGHYGYTDNTNIINSRNGLTVYDSLGSIIFNEEKQLYFLYHRANIGTGRRAIQYSTSKDLIKWSGYNLVKFGEDYNYFNSNMYNSNFFKLGNVYLAILPYIRKLSNDYYSFENIQYNNLYYSYDCINYNLLGSILVNQNITELEQYEFASNFPYLYNNIMYHYVRNTSNKNIDIYSSKKNRFCYITNDNYNECEFKMHITNFNKKHIILNLEVHNNGYILIQLNDITNKAIINFTYDCFDKIINSDLIEKEISWNNNNIVLLTEFIICFKLFNAKLYTINI